MHFNFCPLLLGSLMALSQGPCLSRPASLDTVRLPLAFLSRPGSRVSLPVSWGHLHFGFIKSVHASATTDVQPPQRCEDGAVGGSQASCSLLTSGREKPGRIPKMGMFY